MPQILSQILYSDEVRVTMPFFNARPSLVFRRRSPPRNSAMSWIPDTVYQRRSRISLILLGFVRSAADVDITIPAAGEIACSAVPCDRGSDNVLGFKFDDLHFGRSVLFLHDKFLHYSKSSAQVRAAPMSEPLETVTAKLHCPQMPRCRLCRLK